jgi:hypothetical protein
MRRVSTWAVLAALMAPPAAAQAPVARGQIAVDLRVAQAIEMRSLGDLELDVVAGDEVVVDPRAVGSGPGRFELAAGGAVEVRVQVYSPPHPGMRMRFVEAAIGPRDQPGAARSLGSGVEVFRVDPAEFGGRSELRIGYAVAVDSDVPPGLYDHPVAIVVEATPQLGN